MGELDEQTCFDAALKYGRLRRWCWRCFFGMLILIVLLYLAAVAAHAFQLDLNRKVRGGLFSLFALGWLLCWMGCMGSSIALKNFRCPRCRKRFTLKRCWGWAGNRCLHCQLDLGPSAITKAHAEVDL